MRKKDNIVILGSSSELSEQFVKIIGKNQNIYKISSGILVENENCLQIKDYQDDLARIINFIQKIDNPYIFFFNGYIAENRPYQNPTYDEVRKTIKINFLTPFQITQALLENNKDVKKYIYMSSFAAVKLRYKNFIYGQSKLLLEEFIKNSSIDNFLIIRFGKINTKMSANHKNTIFDMSKEQAAKIIEKFYIKKIGTVYPTILIRVMSIILIFIPKKLIRIFNI